MDHPNNPPSSDSYGYGQMPPFNVDHSDASRPIRSPNFRDCVSRLMLVLVMLVLILGLVSMIAWLVMDPDDPTFVLNSLCVSNITLSDSRFAANYDIEFLLNNTNSKATLVIDHVKISITYGKAIIISGRALEKSSLPVAKTSQEMLKVTLDRDLVRPMKNGLFKDISDEWSKKIVNLNIEMFLRSKYEAGPWPSKEKFFRVSCKALTVEFLSTKGTGKLMSAGKSCSLNLS